MNDKPKIGLLHGILEPAIQSALDTASPLLHAYVAQEADTKATALVNQLIIMSIAVSLKRIADMAAVTLGQTTRMTMDVLGTSEKPAIKAS